MEHKRVDIDQRYGDESFCYSSIPGKATTRDGLKNCFVAGEIIQKGDCRLLGCGIAPGVQLILEDGATAVNCLFGSASIQHNGTMVVRIGKNAVLQDCLVLLDATFGDDSVVCKSLFGYQTRHFETHMPTFTCGKGSLICHSAIQCTPDREEERQIDIVLGNRAVLLTTVLKASGSSFTAGDDFILCDYATALQMCLNGILTYIPEMTQSPLMSIGRENENSIFVVQDQHPQLAAYVQTSIGNRFYCGCEFVLDKRKIKKPVPMAVIGDDVVVAGLSSAVRRQNYERSTTDLILCADTTEICDGATLLGPGNQRWPVPYYRKLTMREGSVAVFSDAPNDMIELTVAANKTITM